MCFVNRAVTACIIPNLCLVAILFCSRLKLCGRLEIKDR